MTAPTIILVMGVSGSGKTTVGEALAASLQWPFEEGDELHPAANVAKMRAGVALTDADREPWLAAITRWVDTQALKAEPGVVTCSALKRAYRDRIREGRPQVRLVFVNGERALLEQRIEERKGHFMPASLLDSQLATLEFPAPDEGAVVVDIAQDVEGQVRQIEAALGVQPAAEG